MEDKNMNRLENLNFLDKYYKKQDKRTRLLITLSLIGIIIFLLSAATLPFKDKLFSLLYPKPPSKAVDIASGPGAELDTWADIIIGKPDFSEINPFTTVGNKLWLPHGIIADRTTTPNKLYIYDGGNNRILGFNLDKCLTSTTNPLNCSADIVLGQSSISTSACNGDSGFQNYPTRAPATASTLCTLQESQLSISEGGSGSSMAVDAQGNLYVTDFFNHRVLKYIRPFETDNIADDVWGQDDFSGQTCNKGRSTPDATTLCFSWGNSNNWTAGVDIDSAGNLWVVDTDNNRVLKFPAGSKTADLVLGQTDFVSKDNKSLNLNRFNDPSAVRVNNTTGRVYVADYANHRVLTFNPPFTSGMNGTVFGSSSAPTGVDFDSTEPGKIWITMAGRKTIELWDEVTQTMVRQLGKIGNGNILGDATGSVGIDSKGNVFIAIGVGDLDNDVVMYAKGGPLDLPSKYLFGRGPGNLVTSYGLGTVMGVIVANDQLIVAGGGRILFWNDPSTLLNGKPADGSAMFGDINQTSYRCCTVAKADKAGHLWVSMSIGGDVPAQIEVFQLPLVQGAKPIKTLTFPFDVLGGGQLKASSIDQVFFGLTPSDNGDFLWLSHQLTNRVFRVRNPLTTPVVDVVLGQLDTTGTQCNRGGAQQTGATPNSLCYPGSLSPDRFGNLYVSDHSLEITGNMRLLVFNKDLFPINNTSVIWAPDASKIFPNIATWEPAFDSQNRMVVGFNPYWSPNPQGGWFPAFYNNPLSTSTTPDGLFSNFHSMAIPATFDDNDNLYIGDGNRNRVLIYKHPFNIPPSPIPTSLPTPTPTPTPTLSPTPSPSPTSPPVQQYGTITGTVYSSIGGTVPGTKITTKVGKTNKTFYSNALGVYSITNLPPGTYSLTFQIQGYVNQQVSASVTANTTTTKNVTMVKR